KTLTLSDSLGYFSLERQQVPETLTVSHIGYLTQEIGLSLGETGVVLIVLKPATAVIDEVEVSTGYQYIPKERATGAFSHIDNQLFNEQVSSDVISRLEAVSNGLDIARTTTLGATDMGIRIRGLSTLSTGTVRNPLIILDNFPYEGD